MEKVYKYSKEEEEKINQDLGYTQEQIEGYWQEQREYTIGIQEIIGWFRWTFHKQCPHCQKVKLIWKNELEYMGLKLPPNCTSASKLNKTYKYTRILVCPQCNSKFYIFDKRNDEKQ